MLPVCPSVNPSGCRSVTQIAHAVPITLAYIESEYHAGISFNIIHCFFLSSLILCVQQIFFLKLNVWLTLPFMIGTSINSLNLLMKLSSRTISQRLHSIMNVIVSIVSGSIYYGPLCL